jgi:small GTP-binding protein
MEPLTILALATLWNAPKIIKGIQEMIKEADKPARPNSNASKATTPRTSKIITVAGRSSVGKSSLCNALIGRSVFATGIEQGTTRGLHKQPFVDGWEIQDTPGLLDDSSYWQTTRKAMLRSKLVVYVTTGQLYRSEQELLKEMHSMHSTRIPLLVLLNMQDLKLRTMPSSERRRELDALQAQLPFLPKEHIYIGSSSPSDGSQADIQHFKSALIHLLSQSV